MADIEEIYNAIAAFCFTNQAFGEMVWNVGFLWPLNTNPAVEVVTP